MYTYDLDHKDGHEQFTFLHWTWDISAAKRLINESGDRPLRELDVAQYVKLNADLVRTDPTIIRSQKIDLTVPPIMLTHVYLHPKTKQIVKQPLLGDGWHRLEYANSKGHKSIGYYQLSIPETDAIGISPSFLQDQLRRPVIHTCGAKFFLCTRIASQTSWIITEAGVYLPTPFCPQCHDELRMSNLIEGRRTVGASKKPLSDWQ